MEYRQYFVLRASEYRIERERRSIAGDRRYVAQSGNLKTGGDWPTTRSFTCIFSCFFAPEQVPTQARRRPAAFAMYGDLGNKLVRVSERVFLEALEALDRPVR